MATDGRIALYLAARYQRRVELASYMLQLEKAGFIVTSRWLRGFHEDAGQSTRERWSKYAKEDLADIDAADFLIAFTEEPLSERSTGGRFVELGYAYAKDKAIIIVGPYENIFCCIDEFERYPNVEEFMKSWIGYC
jgi:nucleoside 2-deoxyribosyltransferase